MPDTPDPDTHISSDRELGVVAITRPNPDGHIAWISGTGYTPTELPALISFLQHALRAHKETTAHDNRPTP